MRLQVDILSKLPKTEFNQKLAATKWSEILEGLNIAVDMIGEVPKLTAGDYGDLVQKVKRLGDHSHVQVKAKLRLIEHQIFNLSTYTALLAAKVAGQNLRQSPRIQTSTENIQRLYFTPEY